MRTWSFVQQKGGSGKSTICTNLAVRAEEKGETVLIVDLDPQSSATLWHSERGTNKPLVLDGQPDKLTDIIASASTLGVSLCLIDSPSKLDEIALAVIRASDMVICPTLPDLFNLGSLQDTVQLLLAAEKLPVTVGVINNVDKAGEEARIGEATAVMEKFKMAVCPARQATSDSRQAEAQGAGGHVVIKKHPAGQDRDGILGTLTRFGRGKVVPLTGNVDKPYVPPSRKNRKSFTTWQDEAALSELRALAHETGKSQQRLVAEALNLLLTKYGKRTVAT